MDTKLNGTTELEHNALSVSAETEKKKKRPHPVLWGISWLLALTLLFGGPFIVINVCSSFSFQDFFVKEFNQTSVYRRIVYENATSLVYDLLSARSEYASSEAQVFPGDFSYYSGYLYYLRLEIPKPETNTDSPSVQTFIASNGFPAELDSLEQAKTFLDGVSEQYGTVLRIDNAGLSLDKVPDGAQMNPDSFVALKNLMTEYDGVMLFAVPKDLSLVENSFWISASGWQERVSQSKIGAGMALGGGLLFLLLLCFRRSCKAFHQAVGRIQRYVCIEWKLLAILVVFAFCMSIPSPIPAFTALAFGVYLFFIDVACNKKQMFTHNFVHYFLCVYRRHEVRLPYQKRMVRRMWAITISEAALIFLSFLSALSMFPYGGSFGGFLLFFLAVGTGIGLYIVFYQKYIRQVEELRLIFDRIYQMQAGDYHTQLALPQEADLAGVAQSLNSISIGLNQAVESRLKSERMKIDLITNVSHDIKTPLTSIISYADLLSKEEGLPEHVQDYIGVLSRKAERLKAMVQDIFEVSKATSGNLDVKKESLDLAKLLRQTLADMEEPIQQSGLIFRVELPEQPVRILSDGNRLYRVFQNLLKNALQYSMPGSRVYLSMRCAGQSVFTAIRNVSKEELPADVQELLERFVRGDRSRTQEGSGLGLNIARSFVEACGGALSLHSDADLFTVTVTLPLAPQGEKSEEKTAAAFQRPESVDSSLPKGGEGAAVPVNPQPPSVPSQPLPMGWKYPHRKEQHR